MEKMDNPPTPIVGYSLDPSGRWVSMPAETVLDGKEKTLSWIHLDYRPEDTLDWLAGTAGLDLVTCDSLVDEGTRPRSALMKEGLLVILRGVNCNPGQDPEDMVAVRMLFCEDIIFTIRFRRVIALQDLKEAVEKGKGPLSKGDFLAMVTESIADRMGDVIQDLEEEIDELEDEILSASTSDSSSKIADIRRTAIHLRRYIAPQRDVLHRIISERVSWITEADRIRLKEVAERTARFVEDIDSIRERAKITMEEIGSQLSGRMNRAVYILSIVTAIFLPLSFLTGLLGINVGGIPGSQYPWAFTIVALLILVIALGLVAWFRKIRWL